MAKVVVWITEDTWRSCVDATAALGTDVQVTLLHAVDGSVEEVMHGAYGGLLARHSHDPGTGVEAVATPAERELLDDAAARLGRDCVTAVRRGRVEHEVVAACDGADLLVLARDGHRRPGPKSLGHGTRFVVDHAPCGVLLVWP